jgi:hypothetical protein
MPPEEFGLTRADARTASSSRKPLAHGRGGRARRSQPLRGAAAGDRSAKSRASGEGRTRAAGLGRDRSGGAPQGASGKGHAGTQAAPGDDHEFEVDRPAVTDGQLDLRLQLAESATTNAAPSSEGVASVSIAKHYTLINWYLMAQAVFEAVVQDEIQLLRRKPAMPRHRRAPSNGHELKRLRVQLRGALGQPQHLDANYLVLPQHHLVVKIRGNAAHTCRERRARNHTRPAFRVRLLCQLLSS